MAVCLIFLIAKGCHHVPQTASHATCALLKFDSESLFHSFSVIFRNLHLSVNMAPRTRSRLHNQSSGPSNPTKMTLDMAVAEEDDEELSVEDTTGHADTSSRRSQGPIRRSKRKSNPATLADRTIKSIPSSLPPSSPPSTSSQLPGSYQFPEIQPISSDPAYHELDEVDPFGFFAAEQELKKSRLPTASRELMMSVDSSHSSQDHGNSIQQQRAFATPKPTDPLRTPRKRTRAGRRKSLATSSPSVGHHEDEDEGTPSPTKPRMPSHDARNDDSEKENANVIGKRKSRKKAKVEADMEPRELARNLEARLPRRPAKAKKARGRPRKVVEVDEDSDEGKARKSSVMRKGKGKAKHVPRADAEDSGEEGEDEKQVRERQARIDYFKRLDGYKVQTEKVFVV